MASYKIEQLSSPFSIIGEGPHWDAESQSLYYNDIYGNEASILRYDYNEKRTYSATIGSKNIIFTGIKHSKIINNIFLFALKLLDGEPVVSFILPVEGTCNEFAVGIGRRVGVVRWDGKSPKAKLVRIAFEVEHGNEFKSNRFNDAKADPSGRFYGGTMRLEECGDLFDSANGSFYKYAAGEEVTKLRSDVAVSNGLAWNVDTNKFYYIDSCQLDVKEFDYDPKTGAICRKNRVFS